MKVLKLINDKKIENNTNLYIYIYITTVSTAMTSPRVKTTEELSNSFPTSTKSPKSSSIKPTELKSTSTKR